MAWTTNEAMGVKENRGAAMLHSNIVFIALALFREHKSITSLIECYKFTHGMIYISVLTVLVLFSEFEAL